MAVIKDPEQLKASLRISNLEYNTLEETAEVQISILVTYPESRSSGNHFSVNIKATDEEIKKLKDKIAEKNAEIHKILDDIKSKIKSLLKITDVVDVALHDITSELLEAVKKGIVVE